ncbi:MAG: IS21 family transposase [Candidatus Omnitrophota bacterium]
MAKKNKGAALSMRKIREILRLALECQMPNREIARSLRVSHVTVGKYVSKVKKTSLTFEDVKNMDDMTLKRLLKAGVTAQGKRRRPEPDWNHVYSELKKKGVTLELLWQEYKGVYPDGYQPTQFYEYYRQWKKNLNPSLYQVHKAGEKMFVDYAGHTVPIHDRLTGKIRQAEIFVAVLGASNYTYADAAWDQSLPNWIGSHVRSFEYFGGVTKAVVPDNLKAGVSRACRYEPDINPTYHDMAVHYGTVIMPARAGRPKDKAKVEAAVQVVERWILAALRNRTFFGLSELNRAIRELLIRLNEKPFKKLDGCRKDWFEGIEKGALKGLPDKPYVFSEWKKARVNIDYHIELNGHYYSVPYSLGREKELEVRYTDRTVEIFYDTRRVASHLRDDTRGRHTTLGEHMPKSHREYLEWSPSRIINWAKTIGEYSAKVVETILTSRGYPEQGYRSCLGILRLAKRYSPERLEAACKRAVAIRGLSYRSIESILKNGLDKHELPELTPQGAIAHENIRGGGYFTGGSIN